MPTAFTAPELARVVSLIPFAFLYAASIAATSLTVSCPAFIASFRSWEPIFVKAAAALSADAASVILDVSIASTAFFTSSTGLVLGVTTVLFSLATDTVDSALLP